jgi:DNA-binding protein HU-beta
LSDSGKSLYGIANLASDVAAHTSGLTEKQVRDVLKTAFSTIMSRLESGERVSIANFGAWRPTERGPRTNRNIRTGAMIQVAARRAVTWSPGTEFKERMKGSYASSSRSSSSAKSSGSIGKSRSVGSKPL